MANGNWELDFLPKQWEFKDDRKKQHAYCPVCEGKGPVTIYECPMCHRTNDLHKPK